MMEPLIKTCSFADQDRASCVSRQSRCMIHSVGTKTVLPLLWGFVLLLMVPSMHSAFTEPPSPAVARPSTPAVAGDTWNNKNNNNTAFSRNGLVSAPTSGGVPMYRAESTPGGRRGGQGVVVSNRKRPGSCKQTCANHANVTCRVVKRSTMCIHRDQSAVDFPNRPRELKVTYLKEGNKVVFNITWKAPYDYSYKAVTGYELHVSQFDFTSSHPASVNCYFVNLSTTDWAAVHRVHDVVYYLDCVRMLASSFKKLHVMIFSYPKLANNHQEKAVDTWVYRGAMLEPNSAGEWVPNITAVQDDVGKSLLIQVRPADKAIDHLKVCVSKQSSVHCMGTVFLLESPEDSYKYRVEDLVANISYTVFIKAFNADGDEITVWFRKKNPVFLQPWPQEPTTAATATIWPLAVQPATPVRHTVQPVKESVGVGLGVMVGLGMLLLLVPLLVVLSACALWHRGYLRNIPFFRVCFPHSATAGPTVKVLQLYVRESEPFQQVVKEHVQYLGHFVHLDVQDCGKMRQQADPALWLARVAADRRVLVYLSPQLTRGLLQVKETSHHSWPNDPYCTTSAVTACANLIHSLAVANQHSSTGRPKGKKPILVLSGGFPSDEEDEARLRQHGSFKALPTFWICKDSLASPAPLVACLSSWHRRSRAPLEDQMLERSQELSQAIASLRCTTSRPQYTPGGDLILNGGGDYMYFRNLNDGRNGYLPHRTDSGFSSSATDHQHGGGSNSSSEHHASPGEACAELGAEEAYTEMEPMIQRPLKDQPLTSVSQLRLFMPPESDAGDLDSMVLAEEFRKVNARGDWSD